MGHKVRYLLGNPGRGEAALYLDGKPVDGKPVAKPPTKSKAAAKKPAVKRKG